MPRGKPPAYKKYPDADLQAAVEACQNGLPLRQASGRFAVPFSTLQRRLNASRDKIPQHTNAGKTRRFTLEEELPLAQHLREMASYGYGYSRCESIQIANEYFDLLVLGKDGPHLTK